MYEYWNIDWLAHHGILNQRWGHRNGPPYPLSSDVSTGQRLKKGAAGSIKKKTPKSGSGRVTKGISDQSFSKEKSKIPADKIYVKRPDNLSEVNLKRPKKDDYWYHEVEFDENGNIVREESKNLPKSKDSKIIRTQRDLISENSKDKSFIDKHTITREPKSQTSTPRFGEVNKDGKVIRTNTDLINEAVERGLAENRRRMETAVNSNQDMFNDILDRTSMGGQTNLKKQSGQQWGDPRIRQAEKEFKDMIKRVAKESGVSKKQLEAKVTENYQKQQEEIRALDNKRHNNKETINRRLQNAKTRDQWDINFLEAVQNKPFTEQHITGDISDSAYKNKMLQEYKKYLEDPEKYFKSR